MAADEESIGEGDTELWLTTGDMARLSDTTLRTVRFYESEGLIASREREDGSHRKFPSSELQKLQIITDLREAGLSLAEIKDLIALKSGSARADQAAERVASELYAQLSEVERRIERLSRVRQELKTMVEALRVCRGCTAPDFPTRCRTCDVMDAGEAARTAQLLWKN